MYFDKRKLGKGLTVGRRVPALNHRSAPLEPGDRLPPQDGLPDVGTYAVVDTPCSLRFWRPARATLTTNANPIWEDGVGLSIAGNCAIDYLHTIALGVMASVVCAVIWALLQSDIFASRSMDKEARFNIGIARLNAELDRWYQSERNQGGHPNQVEAITANMFGKPAVHAIKTKAGETMDLFRWCISSLLPAYDGRLLRGTRLRSCAEALAEWNAELGRQPNCPPPEGCERLKRLALLHLTQLRRAGIPVKPKHHLFWHLTLRTRLAPLCCRFLALNFAVAPAAVARSWSLVCAWDGSQRSGAATIAMDERPAAGDCSDTPLRFIRQWANVGLDSMSSMTHR